MDLKLLEYNPASRIGADHAFGAVGDDDGAVGDDDDGAVRDDDDGAVGDDDLGDDLDRALADLETAAPVDLDDLDLVLGDDDTGLGDDNDNVAASPIVTLTWPGGESVQLVLAPGCPPVSNWTVPPISGSVVFPCGRDTTTWSFIKKPRASKPRKRPAVVMRVPDPVPEIVSVPMPLDLPTPELTAFRAANFLSTLSSWPVPATLGRHSSVRMCRVTEKAFHAQLALGHRAHGTTTTDELINRPLPWLSEVVPMVCATEFRSLRLHSTYFRMRPGFETYNMHANNLMVIVSDTCVVLGYTYGHAYFNVPLGMPGRVVVHGPPDEFKDDVVSLVVMLGMFEDSVPFDADPMDVAVRVSRGTSLESMMDAFVRKETVPMPEPTVVECATFVSNIFL